MDERRVVHARKRALSRLLLVAVTALGTSCSSGKLQTTGDGATPMEGAGCCEPGMTIEFSYAEPGHYEFEITHVTWSPVTCTADLPGGTSSCGDSTFRVLVEGGEIQGVHIRSLTAPPVKLRVQRDGQVLFENFHIDAEYEEVPNTNPACTYPSCSVAHTKL